MSFLKTVLTFLTIGTLSLTSSCGGGGGGGSDTSEPIASNLAYPVRIGELDSKHLIIAELTTGKVSSFNTETKESLELIALAPFTGSGLGISGLLVDKDFNNSGYVFIHHGTSESGRNVLTRITVKDSKVTSRAQLLLLTPPSGHNGGGMYQLDNGNILLGIGDGDNPKFSQDPNKQEGKILIIDREGKYIDTGTGLQKGIYALGFRNPFGISGKNKDIFVADNGPDCDDEIDKLVIGGNYGWREGYECGVHLEGHVAPIYSWSPSQGLTDLLFVEDGTLLASHYNTNTLSSLKLDSEKERVIEESELINHGTEPIIDLQQTKNGEILYTTPTNILILN